METFVKIPQMFFFLIILAVSAFAQISRNDNRVDIIVDSVLYSDAQVVSAVERYASAVHSEFGINIKIYASSPASSGASALSLKNTIKKSWESNDEGKLEGVILMGDLPRPLMEYPQWNSDGFRYQRWTTDYFYMDMDGVWLDTASGWFHNFGGKLKDTILQTPVFNIESNSPFVGAPSDSFSIRFSGYIKASQTGLCSLKVVSDNHRRIYLGDTAVIDAWINDYDKPYYGAVHLKAGELYPIKIEYAEAYGGANFSLYKKYAGETQWTPVENSIWFQDESGNKPGIKATYYGNMFLKDSIDHAGEESGWQSGVPNGVFDGHYSKKGTVSDSFEIWVSRVDPNTASIYSNSKTLLLQWLEKAALSHEKRFVQNKAAFFATSDADTTRPSDHKFLDGLRYIYPEENVDMLLVNGNSYAQSISMDYDWVTYMGHGNELGLANGFDVGNIDYPYEVSARIFHFASCSPMYVYDYVGNHYSISVGSAHVFGTSKGGLAAIGATKTSGDNQLDDLMYYAARDSLLGEAYLSWVNQRIKKNRYKDTGIYDWFYVESLLGDPFVSMKEGTFVLDEETKKEEDAPNENAESLITKRVILHKEMLNLNRKYDSMGRPLKQKRNHYYYIMPRQGLSSR